MNKALEYLYRMKEANEQMGCEATNIKEAIEELEAIKCYICDIEAIVNKRKAIMEDICGKDK